LKIQNPQESPVNKEGVIVAHLGVAVEVLFVDGERAQVRVKRNSGHVVGDSVTVCGEVLQRHPRRSELRRRDTRGGVHLVGANLDVLGVVVAPVPVPPEGFLDRAIVAARSAGLNPFVVINKCDLPGAAELVEAMRRCYGTTLPIFPLSAARRDGLDPLRAFFAEGHRGAFVGTTGVGKSSLLNALCPDIDLRVGEISDHGLGRHTTTVATLNLLEGGGELIDTPGFRDFGLVNISTDDLAAHFPGFESFTVSGCRFRNCRHRSEPGCAVAQLATAAALPAERYVTYLQLLDEVEAEEEAARRRSWKNRPA